MKIIVGAFLIVLFMSGCSHKISITPSLDELRAVQVEKKFEANVAYHISEKMKTTEVTTPGGGGDKITYTPYADVEGALNTMLSKMFTRVYSLSSLNDKKYIEEKGIKYIFKTKIKTNSSSTNILIWPPTNFTVDLTCNAVDTSGKVIWEESVSSDGHAGAGELMGDFSLSAKRATKSAFREMLIKLRNTDKFN